MTDLTIIADEFRDGIDPYLSSEYMVLADGPIKTIDDLKGKVLVTNAIGTANYIGMVAILKQHGMEERRDFTVIEAAFPNMKPMLFAGKADLIGTSPAISYDPELRARARVLYTQKDSMGPSQMTFFTARAEFLAKNRAAVVDFLEDELAGLRWYLDPANRAAAMDILARFTKLPPERLSNWVFTEKDYYRDPSGLPDLAILQKNIESQRTIGLINGDIEVRKYADLSLVTEAASRLK
jgi:NitT/TauT family transport system substrate-binding protein